MRAAGFLPPFLLVVLCLGACAPGPVQISVPAVEPEAASEVAIGLIDRDHPALRALRAHVGELDDAIAEKVESGSSMVLTDDGREYDGLVVGSGFALRPVGRAGFDEPLIGAHEQTSQVVQTPEGPLTESASVDVRMENGVMTSSSSSDRFIGEQDRPSAADSRVSKAEVPVCAPEGDDTEGAWSSSRTISGTDAGATTELRVSATGTVRGGGVPGSPIDVDDLRVTVTRTVVSKSGDRSTDTARLTGRVGGWKAKDVDPGEGLELYQDTESEWMKENAGTAAWSLLAQGHLEIAGAVETARGARESTGACVTIVIDAGGVTSLDVGASATVTATAVDAETGKPVDDAALEAIPASSDVSVEPGGAQPSPSKFTVTALKSAELYSAIITVTSPRGGNSVTVSFTGSGGWAFDGLVIPFTALGKYGFDGTQTWSGWACGDPYTATWQFTVVVAGPEAAYERGMEMVPIPVTAAPGGVRVVPLIEPRTHPEPGEAPFHLYMDDVEGGEAVPQHQRVEAKLRPAGELCPTG